MTFLHQNLKIALKKTAWRQEAGETKGHFYLFTFTFNGLPQTETIWTCTHIQWTWKILGKKTTWQYYNRHFVNLSWNAKAD